MHRTVFIIQIYQPSAMSSFSKNKLHSKHAHVLSVYFKHLILTTNSTRKKGVELKSVSKTLTVDYCDESDGDYIAMIVVADAEELQKQTRNSFIPTRQVVSILVLTSVYVYSEVFGVEADCKPFERPSCNI